MTTWNEVKYTIKRYLSDVGKFIIYKETQDELFLEYMFQNGRTQGLVIKLKEDNYGKIWIGITSAIGDIRTISHRDIIAALEMAGRSTCGGIIKSDGLYLFRQSMLIDDLSVKDLIWPLEAVLNTADYIEKIITRADAY